MSFRAIVNEEFGRLKPGPRKGAGANDEGVESSQLWRTIPNFNANADTPIRSPFVHLLDHGG